MDPRRSRAALVALLAAMLVVPSLAGASESSREADPAASASFIVEEPQPPVAAGSLAARAGEVAHGFAVAPVPSDPTPAVAVAHHAAHAAFIAGTRYEATRYRPRRERAHGRGYRRARGVSQLHAGFLDPDGAAEPGFVLGFRGGQQVDPAFQIGLGLDWRHKSGRSTDALQEMVGPGGERIVVRRDLSRYSSNLFPALLYLQVSAPDMGIVPYFGAAGSWQVLFLEADDFQTGSRFDATYDGFGWQLWGGAAFPLSGRSRLVGEVFVNSADLSRDLYDPFLGQSIRETVSTDGVGARFGINWGL